MADESSEWRQQIAVLKAVAESEKKAQEASMEALRADWRESLARFEAEGAEARAEAAKERAEDRAAAARERAEDRENIANLRAEMEKNTKWQITVILAAIAVAVGILGLWAQILLRSGG